MLIFIKKFNGIYLRKVLNLNSKRTILKGWRQWSGSTTLAVHQVDYCHVKLLKVLNENMNSKDDDTLPLPGFSEELSVDITVDEDFIPTSQPHSDGSSKVSKTSDSNADKSSEEPTHPNLVSDSRIDDTLPPEAVINETALDKDKSTDFIPDTETKKIKMNHGNDFSCKKKLTVDIFKTESNSMWGVPSTSQIPESPALENASILNDTPTVLPLETVKEVEESITEIIVNDSAETVDLEVTPSNSTAEPRVVEVSNSEAERSEDTQIFDNSVLLLDQASCSNVGERSMNDDQPKTVDERESKFVPPPETKTVDGENHKLPGISISKQEVQLQSNSEKKFSKDSIVTRKIDLKLTVTAMITFDTKTNEILEKLIKNVTETPKPQPVYVEPVSDGGSDKSKRHSTSSSGSVYSDKPFALPKRLSGISDMTDSSEEDFFHIPKIDRRNRERIPWRREYMLPWKMDDLLALAVENGNFVKKHIAQQKLKHPKKVEPLEEIVESSTSTTTANSFVAVAELKSEDSTPNESKDPEEGLNNENSETNLENKNLKENVTNDKEEVAGEHNAEEPDTESESNEQNIAPTSGRLMEGMSVFARWSDKRYYSGVLRGTVKNDRWDVMFDDGTAKTVREDFVMPTEWVKAGALVFAMRVDKYESGQVVDVKRGEETNYVIELDSEKTEICVHLSDLCLTEVMAGIIREKYKPHTGTPRGKAEIDFDNVVSGKRLREQRTPLKPVTAQQGGSGSKRSSTRSKRTGLGSIKETPEERKSTGKETGGLKTEDGHLVQDKIISTDSPSATDADETPLRRSSVSKKKGKPRSLSYEEGPRSGKKNPKNGLAPDGTPVPGPSGVKSKKQKPKLKVEADENLVENQTPSTSSKKGSKAPPSTENKRKRKLNESVEDAVQKKQLKDEGKMNTRKRRGAN